MADLYLTPAERYTAALGGFYYGDLPEPGTVYTQLIKDILDGSTPDKEPKNILARFIYSLYISDLGDPYPRYELAKLLYWKLHDITPTKSGSVLTVTIDGEEDYMTINTDLSRLWYKVLFGSKTDVITEFPYIFNTMQNKLSDWELFGNTVQTGTPTPDSPVMPQGTGDKTANLFGAILPLMNIDGNGQIISNINQQFDLWIAQVTAGEVYTASAANGCYAFYAVKPSVGSISIDGTRILTYNQITFTVPNGANYIVVRYSKNSTGKMCNAGSTLLPYQPSGYKIPISSAGQTIPVYLGEVQATRRIKKLVLTGEETWYKASSARVFYHNPLLVNGMNTEGLTTVLSTHYAAQPNVPVVGDVDDLKCCLRSSQQTLYIADSNFATLADFTTYLAAQYAAGTPVTVWYVLAEPTTGIVNEPLMKIGEYADSMSRAQTGIDIPTVIGQNTLDVLTTIKPSSMSIEYTSADENRSRSKRISLLKSPLKKRLIK